MSRLFFRIFIYISLSFFIIALYKFDYLRVPVIHSFPALMYSLVFLFIGFLGDAYSWKKLLEKAKYKIEMTVSISSVGLSIFGKYIPGKIWLVLGRPVYISINKKIDLKNLTILSINNQMIALWVGVFMGILGVYSIDGYYPWLWVCICSWLVLTGLIFIPFFYEMMVKIFSFVLRKKIYYSHLTFFKVLSVTPWFFAYWAAWAIGFYFLILSLTESNNIPFSTGLAFPLSCTIGMLAVITPGGLGIREGIMVGYLSFSGLTLTQATTIAVSARLWYFTGELFIFITGWIMDKLPTTSSDDKLL